MAQSCFSLKTNSTCPSRLPECPFIKKRCHVTEADSFLFVGQNGSVLSFWSIIHFFNFFCMKYSYHIFRICVLWLVRRNEIYTKNWELRSRKREIRYKCSCIEKKFLMNCKSKFPIFPWVQFSKRTFLC